MIRLAYMDTHLSHSIRCIIGQFCTSSHNLEIETGRFRGIQAKDRLCQLRRIEPETEMHHICRCPVYYEIRGRFHCLFRDGFGPLTKVMNYTDQRCLGLFLLELRRHRESLLRRPNKEDHSQKKITDFFRLQTQFPNNQDSQQAPAITDITRGVSINRATELGRSRRPQKQKSSKYRWRIHQKVRTILAQH